MATNDSPLSVAASRALALVIEGAPDPDPPSNDPEATIFTDNFSTGDLSHTENGASWGSQRATSLVSDSGCVVFSAAGSVIDPPSCGFEVREWDSIEGGVSMRFRYGVDADFPMQTWSLNQPTTRVRDIWFAFWHKTPIDYEHVNNSGSSTNNKFFAIWMDGREFNSDGGPTVVFQTRERSGQVGSSFVCYIVSSNDSSGDFDSYTDFISVPDGGTDRDDRGRWQRIVLHMKANDAGAGTGRIQAWRRWENESTYAHLIESTRDVPLPATGYDGWDTVQIMGGDNSWIAEGTEVLMDVFQCSDEPLVPAGTEGL